MKKKKPLKMIIIGTVTAALILAAIVASVFAAGDGSREYDTHMEMAQKYLDELDYEQAVVELRLAIEIEPKDSAAYFALADVYVTMGDYGNAMAALEEGYAATGDEELSAERERIAGKYAEMQEQERKEQEQKEREQRIEEFYEKYAELYTFRTQEVLIRYNIHLTFAEREQAYGGFAEQLEQYLADLDRTEGLPEELYGDEWDGYSVENTMYFTKNAAYEYLAYTYLCMGKLEECLRVRKEWAEFCDMPDLVQDGNHGYNYNEIDGYDEESDIYDAEYDRYGRMTSLSFKTGTQWTYVYEESHNGATQHITTRPGEPVATDIYTYDNEGRTLHRHFFQDTMVSDDDYAYTGNHSFVRTHTLALTLSDGSTDVIRVEVEEQFYDEYGRVIDH